MRIEQLQLKHIQLIRLEAELAVEAAREVDDPRLPEFERHLALALDTEREAIALMKANGISIYPEDDGPDEE
jgi:hypothetical protein